MLCVVVIIHCKTNCRKHYVRTSERDRDTEKGVYPPVQPEERLRLRSGGRSFVELCGFVDEHVWPVLERDEVSCWRQLERVMMSSEEKMI